MPAKRKCTCATVKGNQCSINARAKKRYCGHHEPCKRQWINPPATKRSRNTTEKKEPQASQANNLNEEAYGMVKHGQPQKCFDFILFSDHIITVQKIKNNIKTYYAQPMLVQDTQTISVLV